MIAEVLMDLMEFLADQQPRLPPARCATRAAIAELLDPGSAAFAGWPARLDALGPPDLARIAGERLAAARVVAIVRPAR